MFQSPVSLHFRNCTIDSEIVGEDQQPVALLKLVLEPFTPELADELSPEIKEHCFTKGRKIRPEIDSLTFDLENKQQFVTVKMAEDSEEASAVLRYVRVPTIAITKRGGGSEDATERKKKKVAPPTELLRATLTALVPPDTREIQEFLCRRIKNTFVFQFESEIKELQFGPTPKDDEGDDEGQPELDDTVNEPAAPRLVGKGRKAGAHAVTDEDIEAELASVQMELKPAQIAAMSDAQRDAVVAWVEAFHHANERDLATPPAPDFILNPALLVPPTPDPEAGDVLEEQLVPAKKKRVVKGKFSNTVKDQLKAKKGKK